MFISRNGQVQVRHHWLKKLARLFWTLYCPLHAIANQCRDLRVKTPAWEWRRTLQAVFVMRQALNRSLALTLAFEHGLLFTNRVCKNKQMTKLIFYYCVDPWDDFCLSLRGALRFLRTFIILYAILRTEVQVVIAFCCFVYIVFSGAQGKTLKLY